MTRYAAILAYDGAAYQGFQRQPAPTPTIQAEVERAISSISRQSVGIVAAGRTDTGVHALGQVIAFDVEWKHPDDALLRAINAKLPVDIALQQLWQQAGFHPRFDATWRQYAYRIATVKARNPLLDRHAWQLVGEALDMESMNAAAATLLGEHDFAAFGTPPRADSKNTVRHVYQSRWERVQGDFADFYVYRIRGTAFLYHMVRRLVGTMVQVGRGRLSVAEFAHILLSRDIERAKLLAPPNGLVLETVSYPAHQENKTLSPETSSLAAEGSLEGNT